MSKLLARALLVKRAQAWVSYAVVTNEKEDSAMLMRNWGGHILGPVRRGVTFAAVMGLLMGFGMAVGSTGCGASLGVECVMTGQCAEGLFCVYGLCVEQCKDSRDCNPLDEQATCVHVEGNDLPPDSGITSGNFCQKPKTCGIAADGGTCAQGQTCQEDKCFRQCGSKDPCPINPDHTVDQADICFHGACRSPEHSPDGGFDALAGEGVYCEINSDCISMLCGVGEVCRSCKVDGDCFNGLKCDNAGNCIGPGGHIGTGGAGGAGGGASSGSGAGGAGGSASSGSGTGSSGGSSGSTGGNGMYATCSECTNLDFGAYAPSGQCGNEYTNCMANTECANALNASLFGPPGSGYGPCTTTHDGGCCTRSCVDHFAPSSEAQALFYTLDRCVYCNTCQVLCTDTSAEGTVNAGDYCAVISEGSNVTCP